MQVFETRHSRVLCILVVLAAFAITLLSSSGIAQAQGQTATLGDAVAQGLVSAEIGSTGDLFFQDALTYKITNLKPGPLTITIPVGQVFDPEDSSLQPLMVGQATTINLSPGSGPRPIPIPTPTPTLKSSAEGQLISYQRAGSEATGKLSTFCIALSKHAPSQGENYSVGQVASGPLKQVADAINRKHAQGRLAGQLAVWRVTDDFTLDSLQDPKDPNNELLGLIAPFLGFAKDELKLTQDVLDDSGTGLKFYSGTLPDTIGPGGTTIPGVGSVQKQIDDLVNQALRLGAVVIGGCLLGCLLLLFVIFFLVFRSRPRPAKA